MNKQIIRLTEDDLHNIILSSARKIIKESYDEYQGYEGPDEPEFNYVTVYFNPDTNTCSKDEDISEPGIWCECTVSVANWHMENDGIGPYEFWGHPGYDEGTDYPVIDDYRVDVEGWYQVSEDGMTPIENDTPSLTDEQIEIIKDFVDEDDFIS